MVADPGQHNPRCMLATWGRLKIGHRHHIAVWLASQSPCSPVGLPGAASGAAGVGKPPFNLLTIIGDTSSGINAEQATILQKAIKALRDPSLAAPGTTLGSLASVPPQTLASQLNSQSAEVIKEVRRSRGGVLTANAGQEPQSCSRRAAMLQLGLFTVPQAPGCPHGGMDRDAV